MTDYLEHGIEFTKKYENALIKVHVTPYGNEGLYLARATAMRNNRLVIEAKIMVDEDYVGLTQAEDIAEFTAAYLLVATSKTR